MPTVIHDRTGKGGIGYVAALDAIDTEKSHADYRCDGTPDDDTIEAASVLATTGKVSLSEGTFYIGAPIDCDSLSKMTFEGAGREATILYVPNGANPAAVFLGTTDVQRTGLNFKSFKIHGNKAGNTAGHGIRVYHENSVIDDVHIWYMYESGIYIGGSASHLSSNNHYSKLYIAGCLGAGFDIVTYGQDNIVDNCNIGNCAYNLRWTGGGSAWFFNGCHIWGVSVSNLTINNVLMDGGGLMTKFTGGSMGLSEQHCVVLDCTDGPITRVSFIGVSFRANGSGAQDTYDDIHCKRDSGTDVIAGVTVHDCDFWQLTQDYRGRYGINMGGSFTEQMSVKANHFFSYQSYGAIYIEPVYTNGALNYAIENNTGYTHPMEFRPIVEQFLAIIGASGTQCSLWPFAEYQGTTMADYALDGHDLTPSEDVKDWDRNAGGDPAGVRTYGKMNFYTGNGVDQELDTPDHADFFTQDAFSVGIVLYTQSVTGSEQDLIAKWDETNLAEDREFKFYIDTNGYCSFLIYDENNNAGVGRQRQVALSALKWYLLIGTFSGGTDAADVSVYTYNLNAMAYATDNADIVDDAGFADITNGGSPVSIGYQESTLGVKENFIRAGNKFSWPFYCKKELTADEVHRLAGIVAGMLGL